MSNDTSSSYNLLKLNKPIRISKLLLRVGYKLLDLQVVMNEPDWPWFDVMKVARPLTRTGA